MPADIKWIKLATDMFDDEKIDFITSLPEADAIILTWVRLLTLAGKCNAGGYIYLTENIPYTEDMLSHKFCRPINIIRLALSTLKRLDMMDFDEDGLYVSNWEKHQNIVALEKIRELDRDRKRVKRANKHKSLPLSQDCPELVPGTSLKNPDTELEQELDKEVIPYGEIVSYFNTSTSSKYKASSSKTRDLIKARWNDGFRLNDFKMVIDTKYTSWANNKDMAKFLRPETLFGNKFESYLNEKVTATTKTSAGLEMNWNNMTEEERKKWVD